MLNYMVRRSLSMLLTLVLISLVSFVIIQLPPGDVLSAYVTEIELLSGGRVPPETVEALRVRYGFGEPLMTQYLKWVWGMFQGDFGIAISFGNVPVATILRQRIGMTFLIVILTLVISWGTAIPLGIYAATHKNRLSDYICSVIAFIGISVPDFLLAVIFLFFAVFIFGSNYTGGLFSSAYAQAPWSAARVWDFLKHLSIPLFLLSFGGMAGTFRIMRANVLDTLGQQFVRTAHSKGLSERAVLYKHTVRLAINPLISRLGMQLPVLISGTVILSIVLNLPTLGPPFYRALLNQDMFMAGAVLLLLAITLVIGNFIADLLLAWSDPRIQYD
jgi:peptide/nickel transport system permease protein